MHYMHNNLYNALNIKCEPSFIMNFSTIRNKDTIKDYVKF